MRTALTGYLKPKEIEEKRENSNDPHHGDTVINRCDIRSINRWENVLTVTTLLETLSSASPVEDASLSLACFISLKSNSVQ